MIKFVLRWSITLAPDILFLSDRMKLPTGAGKPPHKLPGLCGTGA